MLSHGIMFKLVSAKVCSAAIFETNFFHKDTFGSKNLLIFLCFTSISHGVNNSQVAPMLFYLNCVYFQVPDYSDFCIL